MKETEGARSIPRPVDENSGDIPSPEQATSGYKPLAAEEETADAGLFPPDVDPAIHIGGSPEEREVLREEFRQ